MLNIIKPLLDDKYYDQYYKCINFSHLRNVNKILSELEFMFNYIPEKLKNQIQVDDTINQTDNNYTYSTLIWDGNISKVWDVCNSINNQQYVSKTCYI